MSLSGESYIDQRRQAYEFVVLTPHSCTHCGDWPGVKATVRHLAELGEDLRDIEIRGKALPLDVPGHGHVDGAWGAINR